MGLIASRTEILPTCGTDALVHEHQELVKRIAKPASFKTYASIRIRGAMLDSRVCQLTRQALLRLRGWLTERCHHHRTTQVMA